MKNINLFSCLDNLKDNKVKNNEFKVIGAGILTLKKEPNGILFSAPWQTGIEHG